MDRLIQGDNLIVMQRLLDEGLGGSVDLIYVDPPFFTQTVREDSAGSYVDHWTSFSQYMDWLGKRISCLWILLKDQGSLYVHLDWRASAHTRCFLDELHNSVFQNEIIWYYGGGGASKRRWARKHDTIMFFTKGSPWKFYADRVRTPYRWKEGQTRADGSERDLKQGKLPDDVWVFNSLMPWAKERTKYPTQKPERLLERILLASSDEEDLVADFFCGSGTTGVVASRLNRRWIMCDENPEAIGVCQHRLTPPYTVERMDG